MLLFIVVNALSYTYGHSLLHLWWIGWRRNLSRPTLSSYRYSFFCVRRNAHRDKREKRTGGSRVTWAHLLQVLLILSPCQSWTLGLTWGRGKGTERGGWRVGGSLRNGTCVQNGLGAQKPVPVLSLAPVLFFIFLFFLLSPLYQESGTGKTPMDTGRDISLSKLTTRPRSQGLLCR